MSEDKKTASAEAKVEKKEEAKKAPAKKAEAKKETKKPAAKKVAKAAVAPALYDVIQSPVITEKSQMASEFNKVVFKIAPKATKTQVKEAVAGIFGVEVLKVNVVNIRGKEKRFRGIKGRRNDTRKAIVTLKEGQNIDIAAASIK